MLCGTIRVDIVHLTVPPDVATLLDVDIKIGSAEDNDLLDGGISLEGVIDVLLEGDDLTTTVSPVGGHHHLGTAVCQTILDALGTESPEHDGVDRPDAGAGQHGDCSLGNEGHVDEDAVPFLDAVTLENVRKFADLAVKLAIGDHPPVVTTGLPLPDDGRLVGAGGLQMLIETDLGGVQLATDEPLGHGKLPIKHLGPFLEPWKFLGLTAPKLVGTLDRFGMEFLVLCHAADAGPFGKGCRRLEDAVFNEVRFDILGHGEQGVSERALVSESVPKRKWEE